VAQLSTLELKNATHFFIADVPSKIRQFISRLYRKDEEGGS
jgi:hypothetical protein